MGADDLRDVVNKVKCVVLVDERQPVEIYIRECLIANPTEPEVRHIAGAYTREQLRDVDVALARQGVVIGGLQLHESAAWPQDEFICGCRAEGGGQCLHRAASPTRYAEWG